MCGDGNSSVQYKHNWLAQYKKTDEFSILFEHIFNLTC